MILCNNNTVKKLDIPNLDATLGSQKGLKLK